MMLTIKSQRKVAGCRPTATSPTWELWKWVKGFIEAITVVNIVGFGQINDACSFQKSHLKTCIIA